LPIPWKTFRFRSALAVLAFTLMSGGAVTGSGTDGGNEYEVKAAFLYKFASFVEWLPEAANKTLCIAVIGDDRFGGALDEVVKGKSVNGRGFSIQRFKSGREAAGCQIVFISGSEKKRVRAILDQLEVPGILTVSEIPGFCEAGGMVNFEILEDKVRFEINPDAAERGGLKVSSKLLSVAKVVREKRPK
jgi:hypothetical protein